MYHFLEQSTDNVIGIRVSQELTPEDYEALVPLWEKAIEQHGKIRLLWVMDDFEGWQPEAAVEDFSFDFKHHEQIERLAVVGENWWEAWMAKVTNLLFPKSEARYFDQSRLSAAWDWVQA